MYYLSYFINVWILRSLLGDVYIYRLYKNILLYLYIKKINIRRIVHEATTTKTTTTATITIKILSINFQEYVVKSFESIRWWGKIIDYEFSATFQIKCIKNISVLQTIIKIRAFDKKTCEKIYRWKHTIEFYASDDIFFSCLSFPTVERGCFCKFLSHY